MSVNRKYADMLAVDKQDMTEEESSHTVIINQNKGRAMVSSKFRWR